MTNVIRFKQPEATEAQLDEFFARAKLATGEPPRVGEVIAHPIEGDCISYGDGKWRVSRRDGWHYPA